MEILGYFLPPEFILSFPELNVKRNLSRISTPSVFKIKRKFIQMGGVGAML